MKFGCRAESRVTLCSQYWSRDRKGGGQVGQTNRRYGEGGGEREGGNLICRAAGRSSRGLLPPPALLRPGDQSVVGVLVSCRGAESMHIKHHGSIFI